MFSSLSFLSSADSNFFVLTKDAAFFLSIMSSIFLLPFELDPPFLEGEKMAGMILFVPGINVCEDLKNLSTSVKLLVDVLAYSLFFYLTAAFSAFRFVSLSSLIYRSSSFTSRLCRCS